MAESPRNQTPSQGPESEFTWKWHAKVLGVIYFLLLIFYVCLVVFLPK